MRLLRGLVVSVGLGVLGLFGLVELALRRRYGSPAAPAATDADEVTGGPATAVSTGVSRARLVLGILGVAAAVYGVVVTLRTVPWTSYLGIVIWLAGAVILHDAVLVPLVSALRAGAHRAGRRAPEAALAWLKAGFVVGAVLSLIALPAVYAKHLGPLNPTILPGNYAQALLLTWLVVIVLTVVGAAVLAALARRQPQPLKLSS